PTSTLGSVPTRRSSHLRGNDQSEYAVAEKFQALVAIAALANGFQRRDVREGGRQQLWIGKLVADPRLDSGCGGSLGGSLGALLLRHGCAGSIRLSACFACR